MDGYTKFTNLETSGELFVGGIADVGDSLYVAGNLNLEGSANVGGDLMIEGFVDIANVYLIEGTLTAPGYISFVELGTVTYEATSGDAASLYGLLPGAILLEVFCVVTEAFNSGDSDVLILGTFADGDALMASADIDETAAATYRKDAWLVGGEEATYIYATLTKTGTAATAGSATFYARVCEFPASW